MEQRANIKFSFKLGKSATETHQMLRQVYGYNAMCRTQVFEWFSRFHNSREDISDDARSGRPNTAGSQETVEKVRELVANDRRMTLKMMEAEIGISRETIRNILEKELGKRKLCSKFVPHSLTPEQKEYRATTSGDFIAMADNDPGFLDSIVTGDECWCFQYDPETKRQIMKWQSKLSPRKQKFRLHKSRVKTMLITFFDSRGLIQKEFVPPGVTVNAVYYRGVMEHLLKRIRRVRPELEDSGNWCLFHDNAPSYSAILLNSYLAKRGITVLEQPPYSPDLAPADFIMFPMLKLPPKGRRFDNLEDIQHNVTDKLKAVPSNKFKRTFQDLYRRCQLCVVASGDYFEG